MGDLVRRRDLTWDLSLVRTSGRLDGEDGYDLVNGRLFNVAIPGRTAGPVGSMLRRLPFGILRNKKPSIRIRALSLLQLLDQRHNVVTFGTKSAGRESVAVPFGNVILLTAASGNFAGGLPIDLRREIELGIEARFSQYIDPGANVRLGSASSAMLNSGDLLAFFGAGVFVPLDGELPVGRVRVGPSMSALSEPVVLNNRPAGLYRGQVALAFGSNTLIAPATARLELDDQVWFYLEGVVGAASAATMIDVSPRGAQPIKLVEHTETADACFCFEFAHADPASGFSDTIYVEVVVDERPSRFLRSAPQGRPAFEIAGLRIGEDDIGNGVEAFWIDFGADGCLVNAALIPRESTIVHDGRRTRRYSWRRYAYDSQTVSDFQVAREGSSWTFRHSGHEPLGYLAAPAMPIAAAFQADWWASRGYHLDWLDFVGCVENSSISQGLAEVHAGRGTATMPSYSTAPEGEFEVGPLILRRAEWMRP